MKKRILSVLITVVMLIGILPTTVFAATAPENIHWAVVQKDSDVILYLGNAAHVMQADETLYADSAQGTDYKNSKISEWRQEITKVVVESEIQPASCAYWFEDLIKCTEMDLQLLNTGSVTSMEEMFMNCCSMTTLTWDTSKFTTDNVTTMEGMFGFCNELTSLDLSHFDTSNVTNMAKMFYSCRNLETLVLSSFDTSDVTDMAYMFYCCYELAYLDLSSFDLSGIAANSTKTLFPGAKILTLKTPKINPHADAFGFSSDYSDEQGNVYTALPVSASAEGVKTLYMNFGIQYFLYDGTGGEGNPTRYAYNKAYSITLTVPQRAGFVFDGWKVDNGPEGVTVVGNTLTIPRYTAGWVYIDTLWKPYTVSVSGSYAPYTATIVPLRDDVTYSWHEYSFGSNKITDESAIYISEYSSGTYDPETGWTPDQLENAYFYFDVSLKSGDTVTVTFADDVDVEDAVLMDGEWEDYIFGVAQADKVILFTITEDGRYTLMTNGIETTAKAIHTGESVSNTAVSSGATFSTGEIGKQYVAKATFTDGGKGIVAYSAPFTYAEQYTVTFDYGTLGSETKTVLSGETVTPPAPVFAGKVLVGWYTDSSFATEFNFSDAIYADNTTIYAKFADYEGDKKTLQDAIDALETAVDTVETALNNKVSTEKLAEEVGKLNQAIADAKTYADTQDATLKAAIEGAGSVLNTAINALKDRVTAIENQLSGIDLSQIVTNKTDIANLTAELNSVKTTVNQLDNTFVNNTELANALATLKGELEAADDTLEALITALDGRVGNIEDALDGIDLSQIAANKTDIEDLVNELSALNTLLNTINTNYTSADAGLQTQITALDAKLTELIDETIAELTDSVNKLKDDLNTANGKIDTNASDISTLKTDVSSLKTWKNEAAAAIEALETLTATQSTNISALQTAVADLQTAVNTANDKITAAENRIAALEDKVSDLETATANLQNAVTALQTAVAGKADTATVTAAIADLQTAIDAMEAVKNNYIGADATLKTELEGKIATAKGEAISAAETLVNNVKADLQSKIDAKADAATTTAAIQNLQAAVAALEAVKDDYATADDALRTALEAAIATAKSEAISAAETLVNNAKAELQSKIDAKADAAITTAAIQNLQAAVAALEAVKDDYATADATLKAELEGKIATAKGEAISAAETLVNNAKAELQSKIDAKADAATTTAAIQNLQAAVAALEAVKDDYATADATLKTELEGKIETAKSEAITAANTALTTAKNELSQAIALKADTATLNAKVDALNTAIANAESVAKAYADTQDAALKAELQTAIANAKSEAIGAAQLLVDNAKAELQTAIDTKADTATVNAAIANMQNAITALEAAKDNYASADAALKLELEAAIDRAKQEAIEASKGYIPYIGTNGNWWIGDTDTGVDANGIKGDTGATGNGIASITTSKANGITTVTIKFTDPNMADVVFTIEDGVDGADGADGADGVGIAKIEKTSSDGNVDTYTITLTNGTTYTFTVTNGTNGTDGKDGTNGKDGVDGKDGTNGTNGVDGKDGTDGEDGQTPYIGENGNWWIGDTDTGVKAAGDDGKDGAIIVATAVGGTALISNIALIAWALIKKKRLF